MDIDDLYQELIIDHGTEPRNCHAMPGANHESEGFNPLCGDRIHVYLLVKDDVIKDLSFLSKGCAISTASASIMSEALKGKPIAEAQGLFKNFQLMLTDDKFKAPDMGKLAALAGVKAFPSRVKCATLAWHTLVEALRSEAKNG